MFKKLEYITNHNLISKILELDNLNRQIDVSKINQSMNRIEETREYISTNNIEGDIISESKAKLFIVENAKPHLNEKELFDRWIGIKIASEYLWSDDFAFDLEHIKQLHRYLMQKSPIAGGVYKSKINQVGSLVTTHPDDVGKEMNKLMIEFQSSVIAEGYTIFNIVAFVSEFLAIHPFEDGNGRMSRMLFNYLIFISGFKFAKYFSISKFLWERKDEYIAALESRNNAWARKEMTPSDLYPLFDILIDVLIQTAKQALEMQSRPKLSKEEFKTQIMLLNGELSFSDIRQRIKCLNSDSSLKVWLGELVKQNKIKMIGEKKATKYLLNK